MDLTKAILALDKESETDLKNANLSNLNEKEEIDNYIQKLRDEAIELFENQKITESSVVDKKLEQDQLEAITELKQKMRDFDEKVDIDQLAEHLLELVRERVCH